MTTWLKWTGVVLLLLAFLATMVWVETRLAGPSEAQRLAVEAMQPPGTPAGRNGFAAQWLLA